MKKQIISFTLLAAGFLLGASALSALATGTNTWTPPSQTPPGGNVSAPVLTDTSSTQANEQDRFGLLGLNDLVVHYLNIASTTKGTSVAAGNVLTSDASGNAAWAPAGGGSGSGSNSLGFGACVAYGGMTKNTSTTICHSGTVMCGLGRYNDNDWDATQAYCQPVYVGTAPTGPATGATCALGTDGGSTGADNTNSNNTSVTITANGQGGTLTYTYKFTTNGSTWVVGNGSGSNNTFTQKFSTGSYPNIAVKAFAYGASPTDTTGVTASCPTLTVTYPLLTAGTLSCALTSEGSSGSSAKVVYTLTGVPTGGTGTYTYSYKDDPSNYWWPNSSTPTGITGSGGSTVAGSSRTLTAMYPGPSSGTPDSINVSVVSGTQTLSLPDFCQANYISI